MQQRNSEDALMIDVSRWQGSPNWSELAADNVDAGYAKATDGATGRDPTFFSNYINMKRAGIARGGYGYAHPGTSSGRSEADALVDCILAAGGFDLDPMLDLEVAEGKSPQELANFILEHESQVRKRTGRTIILYTYTAFILEHLAPVVSQIRHLRLWLADYGNTVPVIPGWDHWTILQYSETGQLPGISGHVDLDAFNGTAAQLRSALTTVGTQSTTPKGVTTMTTDEIKQLQEDLKTVLKLPDKLPNGKPFVDGVLGGATTAAVKSFQYQAQTLAGTRLQVDGTAGPLTLAALKKAIADLKPVGTKAAAPTAPSVSKIPDVQTALSAVQISPSTVQSAYSTAKIVQAVQFIQQGLDILKTL